MTTTTTTWGAFLLEPIDLAKSQPHQMLISSASVAIVAAEAASLVPWPANIALAIGAEWAYLRGLLTGAGVETPWAGRLNGSAVALVLGYGTLWGLRKFDLISVHPGPGLAVLLTLIHIGCIAAVTISSAMLHRAAMDDQARREALLEEQRQARLDQQQAAQDAIALEQARKQAELALWVQGQQAALDLEIAQKQARLAVRRDAQRTRPGAAPAASGTATNREREQLKIQIARTLQEQPQVNKSALARDLGIGRTLLYELIAEIGKDDHATEKET